MDEFTKGLDGLNELIYLSDIHTYELLYINECGMHQFGLENREGIAKRKCYEVLQNKKSPCSFCTNHLLSRDKYYEWETHNEVTGRQYLLKDRLVEYGGQEVRMEIALDITRVANQEQQIQTMFENEKVAMDCARKMQESEDEEETINMVLAELGQRLRGDRTYIFEICGKKMSNTYEWCAPGIPSELRELQSIPTVICHHWIAGFLQAKPYVLKDLETHKDTEPEEYNRLKMQGIHALIAVPLFEQGVLSGFLGIDNPPLENGGNITEILQLIAYFIQSALTRKKATEKLRKMTYTDEMTGVKNRNAFIHKIEQLNARIHSGESGLADVGFGIIFADVNGLKELNDTVGHSAGDQLLRDAAGKISKVFPPADVYRTGGDEFVVLCNDIREEIFRKQAEKLRHSLQGDEKHANTASIGVSWSGQAVYLEEIINEAEADMYEEKRQYYVENCCRDRRKRISEGESDTYTTLLLNDIDVVAMASELLHTILENWDDEKIAYLLDNTFTLFEEEHQVIYQREEAVAYLKRQQEKNKGLLIRDMQFVRKRVIRGISIISCYGWLDWKEELKTCSIPMEMTLVCIQKLGRGKCLYMHSTNIYYRSQYEKTLYQVRNDTLLNMITRSKERRSALDLSENRNEWAALFRILSDSFVLIANDYSNIYFVDIQKDSYVALKTEGKFRSLVGVAGNYTGINRDYAERYMDEKNKTQYLKFTSRKNLLDNLEDGKHFIQMSFSVAKDTEDAGRTVEINIWLGILEQNVVSVFAFHNITDSTAIVPVSDNDILTGLLSYEKFREIGQKIVDKDGGGWAIISIDIQNFKYINEILGYQEGDNILKALSEKLPLLNEKQKTHHTRVTADVFLSLVPWKKSPEELTQSIKDITEQFCAEQKAKIENIKIVLRAGVYFLDRSCAKIDTAIDRANITRKYIDQSIQNEICIYGHEITRKSTMKSRIIATMDNALKDHAFQVWLQPKVELTGNKLCGAEALVRWRQEDNSYIYPDEFIPVFEGNGFITALDFFILDTVCAKLAEQKSKGLSSAVRISINLSAVDVVREGIEDALTEIADRYQVKHSSLEFELTETAYFNNSNVAAKVMERLRKEGFYTSVDDFGSGYSVMNLMINMPASVVKIDRVFMLDCLKTERGRSFLEKLIGMIHELGCRALCEGIETREQCRLLAEMGCDEGQGYYFARPMPMETFFEKYK